MAAGMPHSPITKVKISNNPAEIDGNESGRATLKIAFQEKSHTQTPHRQCMCP